MMMGEFVTLFKKGYPVKIVVLNNGTLGFVEIEMKASGFLDSQCDLKNPNFADMAQAMGNQRRARGESAAFARGGSKRALA